MHPRRIMTEDDEVVCSLQEPQEEVFEFYHTPLSQPSAAVKTLLDISGAKYNTHIINLL